LYPLGFFILSLSFSYVSGAGKTTGAPGTQFAGVATFSLSEVCSASTILNISGIHLPIV